MVKKKVKRIKTGLAGAPLHKGFKSVKHYFFTELDKKDYVPLIKEYVKTNYSIGEQKIILSNPDWSFNFFNYASMAYWLQSGFELTNNLTQSLQNYMTKLLESGKISFKEKQDNVKHNSRIISPSERLKMKVNDTIINDIDFMLDDWMDSKRTSIDVYKLVKEYDIKGIGLNYIEHRLQRMFDEYDGAYNKTDDQLVEGYNYLKRSDMKWYKEECQRMIDDIKKLQSVRKANRSPRKKKSQTAETQIKKLQFKNNDSEYKLESINPILVVGALELYLFNTKTRKMTLYKSNSMDGLSVSGTSIKNFNEELSYLTTLRKPDDVLKNILTMTPAKLKKYLDSLTTKRMIPNGRINNETILVKVVR